MSTLRRLVIVVGILGVLLWHALALFGQCGVLILLAWVCELTCAFVVQVENLTIMLPVHVLTTVALVLFGW